jgi:hypothetical protein
VSGAGRAADAAAVIRECQGVLAARGGIMLREALGGRSPGSVKDWRHYPAGDAYDSASHAQYFYHRHPIADRAAAEEAA